MGDVVTNVLKEDWTLNFNKNTHNNEARASDQNRTSSIYEKIPK